MKTRWFIIDLSLSLFFLIVGENQEQLRIHFFGLEKLSCRAKNPIGQTEASININILCKINDTFL
jgi:hypothetical protein